MIAGRDSTPKTMLLALSHSIGALKSAVLLDVDRSPDDHLFFNAERAILETHFNALFTIQSDIDKYELLDIEQAQSAIDVGDAILDRGVRRAKKRSALELANIDPGAVDRAFPSDIEDIVDAERKLEPKLVLDVVDKFKFIPAFNGKADVEADLKGRATKQKDNFLAREAAETHADGLDNQATALVIESADALYRLEKRLLERFPREKAYVRAFFLDVRRNRKSPEQSPPVPQEPNTP